MITQVQEQQAALEIRTQESEFVGYAQIKVYKFFIRIFGTFEIDVHTIIEPQVVFVRDKRLLVRDFRMFGFE